MYSPLLSMCRSRCAARAAALVATCLLVAAFCLPAQGLAADPEAGRRTFQSSCASCHAVASASNGFGPHLKGVLGRPAASLPDYAYSPAMADAGEKGLVWDEPALSEFLSSPSSKVPGTKMRFFGFWTQSSIDDVIAYLRNNP
ncbi:cytochrome c family protein [Rhizobium sp. 0TCS1.26]|uniref:c-type cytochrome n=1 Tax=Rhizobium sp. 0TCS1.26 TaxID=3142623 RepID=UPI003D2D2CBF